MTSEGLMWVYCTFWNRNKTELLSCNNNGYDYTYKQSNFAIKTLSENIEHITWRGNCSHLGRSTYGDQVPRLR